MKLIEYLLISGACCLIVAGCAPGGSQVEPSVPQPVAQEPTGGSTGQPAEDVPDRETDPAGFWNWRVDQLFLNRDADRDGTISRDEFEGNPSEFDVMDADNDGNLSREEVVDHVFARYMVPPVSSVD
jgi:hypothetical protein